VVDPYQLDSSFDQPGCGFRVDINVVLAEPSLTITPERRVGCFEKYSLRLAVAIRHHETSIDHANVIGYGNDFGFAEQTFERQGIDFRTACDKVCRSIDVRS